MQKTWRATVLLVVSLVLVVPALALASGKSTTARPTATHAAGPVQSLRLAIPHASTTVDPALVADEENVQLANLLYSGLVRLDASYHVVPDAAASYKLSPDHRTYTFYLRRNLKFSNGDLVTAKDFRWSLTRSLTPTVKSPSAPTYLQEIQGARAMLEGKAKSVSGIRVLNPSTLQITTVWPVPYFLMELTYPTSFVLDRKRITKLGPVENGNWYSNPIGTGPFKLKSWVQNSRMILVPNKNFYGTRPALKSITISLGPLPDSDLYQYVNHNLDVVSLPAYSSSLLHQAGIHEAKMLAVDGVYMSYSAKPFGNIHVRRALTLALNRSGIVTRAMGATVTPFAGHVPPGQDGYDPRLKALQYDPVAARNELKAAGTKNAKLLDTVTLYYADDPAIAKLALGLVKAWRTALRITIDTRPLTLNTLLAKVQTGSLPLYLLGWSADYPDPHDFLSLQWKTQAPNNNVHFSDKKFDDLVSTADVTWPYNQRMRLYDAGQQQLVDKAAWIPLYIPHRLVFIRPTVVNLVLTGYGIIPRMGTWAQVQMRSAATRRRIAE